MLEVMLYFSCCLLYVLLICVHYLEEEILGIDLGDFGNHSLCRYYNPYRMQMQLPFEYVIVYDVAHCVSGKKHFETHCLTD